MNSKKLVLKSLIASAILVSIIGLSLWVQIEFQKKSEQQKNNQVGLRLPEFLKPAYAAEDCQISEDEVRGIVDDAGLTAYAKLNQEIEIAVALPTLETVAEKTQNFVSGTVIVPGYREIPSDRPHATIQVLIHRCGWIFAYLSKYQPSASAIDWVNFDNGGLRPTTLERVLKEIVDTLSAASDVEVLTQALFDFGHPDATNVTFAVQKVDVNQPGKSFQVTIPKGVTISASSLSIGRFHQTHWDEESQCNLNSKTILSKNARPNQWNFAYRDLTETEFPGGTRHTIELRITPKLDRSMDITKFYCGLAVLYKDKEAE